MDDSSHEHKDQDEDALNKTKITDMKPSNSSEEAIFQLMMNIQVLLDLRLKEIGQDVQQKMSQSEQMAANKDTLDDQKEPEVKLIE